jgi:alpha 1,2-mannosyltransferase
LHYIVSFSYEGYGRATSFSFKQKSPKPPYQTPLPEEYYNNSTRPSPQGRKANAVIVMLARNGDLGGITSSVKQMEDRFNKKFQYPYVFLNEELFSDDFKS